MAPHDDYLFDPQRNVFLVLTKPSTAVASTNPLEAKSAGAKEATTDATAKIPVSKENTTIQARVSSNTLALASPFFRNLFAECSDRSQTADDVPNTFDLCDDDADAMVILLDILHHRNNRLPAHVPVTTLAQLAFLIDKYEMMEAAGFRLKPWFDSIWGRYEFRSADIKEHHLERIFLCWFLKASFEFQQVTGATIKWSLPDFADHSRFAALLPASVLADIKSKRFAITQNMNNFVTETILSYTRSGIIHCRNDIDCDALVLGNFIKVATKAGIYPTGCVGTFDEPLGKILECLDDYRWSMASTCQARKPKKQSGLNRRGCILETTLVDELRNEIEVIMGLAMQDYLPKQRNKRAREDDSDDKLPAARRRSRGARYQI